MTAHDDIQHRAGSLLDRYQVPPFSVLDTRQGYWQEARRAWLALGIRSELGRGFNDDAAASPERAAMSLVGLKGAGGKDANWDRSKGPAPVEEPTWIEPVATMTRREMEADSNVTGAAALPEYSDMGMANIAPGTSIFDPVMCELAYRWWCPEGGTILDPFSGGSVRGIVAAWLGHPYYGFDLAAAQVASNREQADAILRPGHPLPSWIVADSAIALRYIEADSVDMVFSCPPYFDLEVYSDDPADLSVMTWQGFLEAYRGIIREAVRALRPSHFAAFVVSEIRGPDGTFRGLVPETIRAFEDAGARYYNEAILVNPAGTLPLRVGRQFEAGRKLGRSHQNVLVFTKGTPPKTHGWSYAATGAPAPQVEMFDFGPDIGADGRPE